MIKKIKEAIKNKPVAKTKAAIKTAAKTKVPAKRKKGSSPRIVTEVTEVSPVKNLDQVKIEWLKKPYGLAQIYTSGLEYCFVSQDNKQVCPYVYCKDFLQDALMAYYNNKEIDLYGFCYSKKNDEQIYLERTKISLVNAADKDFNNKIPTMMDFIHQIEKDFRLVRSIIKIVENPPEKYKNGAYLMESSSRWMIAPPMISLFSLLIRVGFTHKKGDTYVKTMNNLKENNTKPYQTNDASQMKEAQTGFDKIKTHGYAKIFWNEPSKNYPAISENSMHYDMGICAFSANTSSKHVKHWHRNLNKSNDEPKKTKKV